MDGNLESAEEEPQEAQESQEGADSLASEGDGDDAQRETAVSWLRPVFGRLYTLLTVLSALALAAAAGLGLIWVAVAALGVALAADWVGRYSRGGLRKQLNKIGMRRPQRAMLRSLVVAVAVGVAADEHSTLLILYGLVAVGAHGLGTLTNAFLGWGLGRSPMFGVRNIGEQLDLWDVFARAARHRPSVPSVHLACEWLAVVGIAIALSTDQPVLIASIAAGVALALMLAWTAAVYRWVQRLRGGTRIDKYERKLLKELRAYDPEVLVYLSAAAGSGYMINQWLPAFEAMKRRAVILLREKTNIASLAETSLPVILAPQTRDVERMLLPNVRVAIYVANAGRNVHLLREASVKHVFLNHGDSDKSTSANPVARVYDEVWVAGEAAIDRYEAAGIDIPRERFALIGRPQVISLPVGQRVPDGAGPRVLYAPTWEGIYEESNYSSLEVGGVDMIRAILEERPDVGIIFKPHPASGAWRPQMRGVIREIERILGDAPNADRHLFVDKGAELKLNDCFELADVLISDISSVVTDFLQTERPIIISNPKSLDPDAFRVMFPTQAASYIVGPDFKAVPKLLDTALGDDPEATARREMKRYVFGDLPEGPIQAFSDHADRIWEDAERHAERVRNNFTFGEMAYSQDRAPERLSLYQKLRPRT